MNNFFYNNSEYSLFKRALRTTKNEPVVINISSTDASLIDENSKQEEQVERKVMSQKFEPSPFGKFFGPRKTRTTPVDMKDYSSWKNKNYRKVEQNINEDDEEKPAFSLTDYMNRSFGENKFNDEDQLRHDNQKPIDQLSNDDPVYQKFSLDSYLNKLEEQNKVQSDYETNSDLLEPLKDITQEYSTDSSQDEEFTETGDVDVEQFALDEHLDDGNKFSFDTEELEKVKNRIEKIEKQANNIKDKPTEKVINTNELTESLNLEKLGVGTNEPGIGEDDIEKINKNINDNNLIVDGDIDPTDENNQTPKVSHKKFMEINKTPGTSISRPVEKDSKLASHDEEDENVDDLLSADEDDEFDDEDKLFGDEDLSLIGSDEDLEDDEEWAGGTDRKEFVSSDKTVSRDDLLTKDDLKTFGDEFMQKFTKLYGGQSDSQVSQGYPSQEYVDSDDNVHINEYTTDASQEPNYSGTENPQIQQMQPIQPGGGYVQTDNDELMDKQNELQAKILEMIESNKKSDLEAQERLRQVELEKSRITEDYEERLKELEQSFKKRDEELKKQAYIDKLKNDIKLKKAESNYKLREEKIKEFEKNSSEQMKFGVMLKKELKNNLNVSNLEMDKKLLEIVSKVQKEQQEEKVAQEESVNEEVEEVAVPKVRKTAPKAKKRTTRNSHSHTRTPRRKIDSDIIGGINFD